MGHQAAFPSGKALVWFFADHLGDVWANHQRAALVHHHGRMVQVQAMQVPTKLGRCSLSGFYGAFGLHRLEVQQHDMAASVAYEAVKHACNVVVGYDDAQFNGHGFSALQEPAAA